MVLFTLLTIIHCGGEGGDGGGAGGVSGKGWMARWAEAAAGVLFHKWLVSSWKFGWGSVGGGNRKAIV